jgi:acyl-coenzyme A synthetase/AMP-(fatty) acid ligase
MRIEAGLLPRLCAERHRDRPALTYGERTMSFQALSAMANRLGSGLRLQRGDRVGVLTHNTPETVAAWLGLEAHNLVRVVMHAHIPAEAHAWTLEHVEAKALIFDTRMTAIAEECRGSVQQLIAVGDDPPDWATPYAQVLENGSPEHPYLDVDEDAPCFLQLTSGTTGRPKPWIKTYRSWHAVVDQNMHHLDTFGPGALSEDDVNLHFHPIQWASGFQTLYPYLLRGARSVIADDAVFDPGGLVDTIVGERVTGMLMPAPMLPAVLDAVEARGGIEHAITRMVIFFATPDLLARTTQVLGPIWAHGFGSSEQGAVTTRLLPEEVAEKPERIASVGRGGAPFFDVAIFDPDGRRLPAGAVGEIAVRSAMSLGAYWGLPDATQDAFFANDWFRPRDIGYLDEDGFLYYADRAGDEITTQQGTIYPHYVETALLTHPQVANCAVVGVNEEVVAAILLCAGADGSPELEQAILDRVDADAKLTPNDRPSRCFFVGELPTVLGGAKVQRSALRTQLLELA